MKQNNIRVTREFTFEMAHALNCYDGLCRNIHGHSYHLKVTVMGKPLDILNDTKEGMVIDFKDIKHLVQTHIVSKLDHAIMLREDDKLSEIMSQIETTGIQTKIIWTPYQPTCENMVLDMVQTLQPLFTDDVSLYSIHLRETANAYAEWYATDNR